MKKILILLITAFSLFGCKNSNNSNSEGKGNSSGGHSSKNEFWCVNKEINAIPETEILVEGDPNCEHYFTTTYLQPQTCTQNEKAQNVCTKCGRITITYRLKSKHVYNDFNVCEICGDKIDNVSTGLVYEEVGNVDGIFTPTIYGTNLRSELSDYRVFVEKWQQYNAYVEYGNFCVVTGIGSCSDENLVIPSMHAGRKVIGIKEKAFYGNDTIKSVTLTQNVTYIGDQAFDYCVNLEKVNLPTNISCIGKSCFGHCPKLNDIYIPRNITLIDNTAFLGSAIEKNKNYYKNGIFSISGVIINGSTCEVKKLTLDDHYCAVAEGAFTNWDNVLEELDVVDDDVFLNQKSFTTSSLKTVNITTDNDAIINGHVKSAIRPFLGAKIQKASCTTELVYLLIEDIGLQDGIKDLTILNYHSRYDKELYFLPKTYLWGFPSLETLHLKGKLADKFNLMSSFTATWFRYDTLNGNRGYEGFNFGRNQETYIPKNFKTVCVDDLSQFVIGRNEANFKLENLRLNKDSEIETFLRQSMFTGVGPIYYDDESAGVENLYLNSKCKYYLSDSYVSDKNHHKFIKNLIYEGTLENFCQFYDEGTRGYSLSQIANNILLNNNSIDFGKDETFTAKYYGVDNFNFIYGKLSAYGENNIRNLIVENGFTNISIRYYENLETIILPNSVTTIKSIVGCGIKTFIMPDTVTQLESNCISENNLETVVFSRGLTSLPHNTISYEKSLKSIFIPRSIIDIDSGALPLNMEGLDIYFEVEEPLDSWKLNFSSAKCNFHWGCSGLDFTN